MVMTKDFMHRLKSWNNIILSEYHQVKELPKKYHKNGLRTTEHGSKIDFVVSSALNLQN